jgi:hypothetical protein
VDHAVSRRSVMAEAPVQSLASRCVIYEVRYHDPVVFVKSITGSLGPCNGYKRDSCLT